MINSLSTNFSLLEMLPDMFKDTRETDVVLGPVVSAGLEALKVNCMMNFANLVNSR